jgi:hypothetical protein
MKKAAIVVLGAVNAALLLALLFGAASEPATAQVIGGGTDYIVHVGRIDAKAEAVFVIDLARQRMLAWQYDSGDDRMVMMRRGRELQNDFRPGGAQGQQERR